MQISPPVFRHLLVFGIALSCFFIWSCGDSSSKNASVDELSVPASGTSASGTSPFSLITLGATSLEDSDVVQVTFTNAQGYSVTLTAVASNPLQVVVPLYVNPVSGELDSGSVTLSVTYPDGSIKAVDGNLTIAAPPIVEGVTPGTLTQAFVNGTLSYVNETQTALSNLKTEEPEAASLVTTDIEADLALEVTTLQTMSLSIDNYTGGDSSQTICGANTSDGEASVTMDSAMLTNSDRIVAAFLNQILVTEKSTLAKTTADVEMSGDVLVDLASHWTKNLTTNISSGTLESGKKVGGTVGGATAIVGVLVAVTAATPMVAAIGTSAALIGAVGYLSSTFVPGATAMFLNVGTSIILDGGSKYDDIQQGAAYIVGNTLAQGTSYLGGEWIGSKTSDLGGALAGYIDNEAGITARVSEFVAKSIFYANVTSCFYTLSAYSVTNASTDLGGSFVIITDCAWKINTEVSWINITSDKQGTGMSTVLFSLDENTTGASRTGTIMVGDTITFTVTQLADTTTSLTSAFDGTWTGYYIGTLTTMSDLTETQVTSNMTCDISSGIMSCTTTFQGSAISLVGAVESSGTCAFGYSNTAGTAAFALSGAFSTTAADGTWAFGDMVNGSVTVAGEGDWELTKQ